MKQQGNSRNGDTAVIENNYCFSDVALKRKISKKWGPHTIFPWKVQASYFNLKADGQENKATWYLEVSELTRPLKGRIPFWKGVKVGV